jgi:hypothetical protein
MMVQPCECRLDYYTLDTMLSPKSSASLPCCSFDQGLLVNVVNVQPLNLVVIILFVQNRGIVAAVIVLQCLWLLCFEYVHSLIYYVHVDSVVCLEGWYERLMHKFELSTLTI